MGISLENMSGGRRVGGAPSFIAPQLAVLAKEPPRGDGWLHELKLDGWRIIVVANGEKSALYSRSHKPWTKKLPTLARAAAALGHRAVVDGEAVTLDERGLSSFEDLVLAVHRGREREVLLLAFDLLWLDGWDLTGAPLEERKRALAALLAGEMVEPMRYLEHVEGRGAEVFAAACRAGAEGILSKRADAPHRSRRDPSWRKVKCALRQELVVVGYTPPTHASDHLGSLVLAYHDDDGKLRYAGRVGTGFSREERRSLRARLDALARAAAPLDEVPRAPGLGEVRWAKPRLVAEITFSQWTRAGRVRHPSFLGLRADKRPDDVVRELPLG